MKKIIFVLVCLAFTSTLWAKTVTVPIYYGSGDSQSNIFLHDVFFEYAKTRPDDLTKTGRNQGLCYWNRNIYLLDYITMEEKEKLPPYKKLVRDSRYLKSIPLIEEAGGYGVFTSPKKNRLMSDFFDYITQTKYFSIHRPTARTITGDLYEYRLATDKTIRFIKMNDGKRYYHSGWQPTIRLTLDYSLNDTPVTMHTIPLWHGGYDAFFSKLEQVDTTNAVILDIKDIFIGNKNMPRKGWDESLTLRKKYKFDAIAVNSRFLRDGFDYVKPYTRLGDDESPIPFLSGNVLKKQPKEDEDIEHWSKHVDKMTNIIEQETLFTPYIIKEVNGIRIGIFNITDPNFFLYHNKKDYPDFELIDHRTAATYIAEILKKKADVVIAIAHIDFDDLGNFIGTANNIDVVIGFKSGTRPALEKHRINIPNRNRREYSRPYLIADVARNALGKISVTADVSGNTTTLKRIEFEKIMLGPDVGRKNHLDKYVQKFIEAWDTSGEGFVTPSPLQIWPDESITYFQPKYRWQFFATLLLKAARKELVLIPMWRFSGGDVDGPIPYSLLKEWFDEDYHIVTFSILGKDLKKLMMRAKNKGEEEISYLYLGYEGNTINALPIKNDEYYGIVSTSYFTGQRKGEFNELSSIKNIRNRFIIKNGRLIPSKKGEIVTLKDFIPPAVKEKWEKTVAKRQKNNIPEDAPYPWYKEAFEGLVVNKGPFYKIHFNNIAFNIVSNSFHNNQNYTAVRDSRINASKSLQFGGLADIAIEVYDKKYSWQTGIDLGYAKYKAYPSGSPAFSNETDDHINLYTELFYKLKTFDPRWYGSVAGPFLNVSYNSEFTAIAGNPRSQIIRLVPGFELRGGTWIQQARAGLLFDADFSENPTDKALGLNVAASIEKPIHEKLFFSYATDLKYTPYHSNKNASDLELLWDHQIGFKVNIIGELYLQPYASILLFRGTTVKDFGQSYMLGMQFSFSKSWKPQFEPLF
jgi:hypothetical protein